MNNQNESINSGPSSPVTVYVSPRSFSSTSTPSSVTTSTTPLTPVPITSLRVPKGSHQYVHAFHNHWYQFCIQVASFLFHPGKGESEFTFSLVKSTLIKDIVLLGKDSIIVAELMNLRAYSLLDSQPLWTLQPADYLKPSAICLVDSNNLIVMGTTDGHLFFINSTNGVVLAEHLAVHGRNNVLKVLCDAFNKNGHIYSIDESGKMFIWDRAGRKLGERAPSPSTKNILVIEEEDSNPSFSFVVAYGSGTSLFMLPDESKIIEEINDPSLIIGMITCIHRHSQDLVLTGHDDGKLVLWNIGDKSIKAAFILSNYRIESISIGDGFDLLWIGDSFGVIRVVDIEEKVELLEWKWHSSSVIKITSRDLLVMSLDSEGNFGFWEKSLTDYKMSKKMMESIESYSDKKLFNLRVCCWNVGAAKPPLDNDFYIEWADSDESDLLVIGLQEMISLDPRSGGSSNAEAVNLWIDRLKSIFVRHELLHYDSMVGLMSCIFIRKRRGDGGDVKVLESCQVKTGLGGLYGNKGALAVRLILNDTSFCFINCHLPAGQESVSARNTDLGTIIESTKFSPLSPLCAHSLVGSLSGTTPLDHQHLFIFGDLNYRIMASQDESDKEARTDEVLQSINEGTLGKLVDQLTDQRKLNPFHPLNGFSEAMITFRPTYKFERFTSTYDLQRSPAWCDRILYKSQVKGIECEDYRAVDSMMISDHKPVSCSFKVSVYSIDWKKQRQVYLIKKLELEQS